MPQEEALMSIMKKQRDIQELKLHLLHEICQISTGTFEIDSLPIGRV
jgi:hypothetical protein